MIDVYVPVRSLRRDVIIPGANYDTLYASVAIDATWDAKVVMFWDRDKERYIHPSAVFYRFIGDSFITPNDVAEYTIRLYRGISKPHGPKWLAQFYQWLSNNAWPYSDDEYQYYNFDTGEWE